MITKAKAIDSEEVFTFFWKADDVFSHWNRTGFEVDGVHYPCGETFIMAEKARLFGDRATLGLILAETSPKRIKALGRDVTPFDEDVWLDGLEDLVMRCNAAKFEQNRYADVLLRDTAGTTLVEASPFDKLYGIMLGADDPRARSRTTWKGRNVLGDTLTKLRVARHGV